MELIVINERKLKVMLSDEEMTQYDLDTIDACPGADIHTSLRGMMGEIRKKTGFNADCERCIFSFIHADQADASCILQCSTAKPMNRYQIFSINVQANWQRPILHVCAEWCTALIHFPNL